MQSIWSCEIPKRPKLAKDLDVDVAVIGGGMAGILIAYQLMLRDIDVVVLEAERIGSGQTSGTTAKITSQHGHVYARLIEQFGHDKAKQYGQANQAALEEFARIVEHENISCEFSRKPAYVYSTRDIAPLEMEAAAAKSLSLPASLVKGEKLPFPAKGAVRFEDQAQFHPLKFLKAVAAKVPVYEQSRVVSLDTDALSTQAHTVRARHIVFACHYPFINKPGYYFARIHQERSYVLALEGAPTLPGMYISMDDDGHSMRSHGNYLLFGGEGHRTGEHFPGRYDALREAAQAMFPGTREAAHWSAQDAITLDGVPFIGRYARSRPAWHVATGFMKWGMTTSMAAAMILADDICKKRNRWASIFRPQRFSTAELPSLSRNSAQAVKGLLREAAPADVPLDELPAGQGGVVEVGGKKLGAYKDPSGNIFFVTTRCPHLGCELSWNQDELSWDCPCHGSRFACDGGLISGPAQTGIAVEPPEV